MKKEKKKQFKQIIKENKYLFKRKKKYDISDEFGIFKLYKLPFNEVTFRASNRLLEVLPKRFLKSDKEVKITKSAVKMSDKSKINIYIFENKETKTDKSLLYIHGGGFVYKASKNQYDFCRRVARNGNYKVVFVDYRLAYEYKFPTSINDCFETYKWMIANKEKLQIDENKIVIGGDSAGGCLVLDVVKKSIDENIIIPKYMFLLYPVLDKRMKTESIKKYTDTPVWNSVLNRKMWELYLSDTNDYISPNEIKDLSKYPNAYIETAEFDCLHDEAIEFSDKLKKLGKKVILNETKHTMHGFDMKECKTTEGVLKKRIQVLNNFFK